jgi:hypothetical protein
VGRSDRREQAVGAADLGALDVADVGLQPPEAVAGDEPTVLDLDAGSSRRDTEGERGGSVLRIEGELERNRPFLPRDSAE